MDQFSQRNAKVVVRLSFLVSKQVGQALGESLQDLDVGKVLLCEPCCGDDAQLGFDCSKVLRAVTDDHDRLLYGAPGDLDGAMEQLAGIQLARTRNAKEARGGVGIGRSASQGEVGVVLGGAARSQLCCWRQRGGTWALVHSRMRAVAEGHEGKVRPFILHGRVRTALLHAEPSLYFWAPALPLASSLLPAPPQALSWAYRAW